MSSFIDDIFWGGLVLIILIVLPATNPNEAAHRAAYAQKTPVASAIVSVGELAGCTELKYHNYFLFSVMTVKASKDGPEMPLTIGFLGKVYYGKDK
jgi:hypothetical protein